MDHQFCPGSKLLRQPAPEIFICSDCGEEVEIWTDELKGTCSRCGKTIYRDAMMGCLDWCKYGKECVGEVAYDNYMKNKMVGEKHQLLKEMRGWFGKDEKRIRHAENVFQWAEKLLRHESGDWHIVIPAAILHDVGIKTAEKKCGSAEAPYQEKEGPRIARKILLRLGLTLADIDRICDIIAHHHSPGKNESLNFKILYDADRMVNTMDSIDGKSNDEIQSLIDTGFLTDTGKRFAGEMFLSHTPIRQPRFPVRPP